MYRTVLKLGRTVEYTTKFQLRLEVTGDSGTVCSLLEYMWCSTITGQDKHNL